MVMTTAPIRPTRRGPKRSIANPIIGPVKMVANPARAGPKEMSPRDQPKSVSKGAMNRPTE